MVTINHVGIEAGWLRKQLSGGEEATKVIASDAADAAAAAEADAAADAEASAVAGGVDMAAAKQALTDGDHSSRAVPSGAGAAAAAVPTWRSEMEALRRRHAGKKIIGSVTRLERMAGLASKLLAFEQLLTAYPFWRDKVILVQRCIVRPTQRREAMRCADELAQLVQRIEARFGPVIDYQVYDANCPGVLFAGAIRGQGTLSLAQRLGLWAASDVFCDTSLRAGLDLMPIEYLLVRMHVLEEREKTVQAGGSDGGGSGASNSRGARSGSLRSSAIATAAGGMHGSSTSLGSTNSLEDASTGSARLGLAKRKVCATAGGDGAGVIVLSEFSTMCNVLNGAVRTNPWSGSDVVNCLDGALTMASEDQRRRLARDEPYVSRRGTGRWFRSVLNDLEAMFSTKALNTARKAKQEEAAAVRRAGGLGQPGLLSGQPERDFEALNIAKVRPRVPPVRFSRLHFFFVADALACSTRVHTHTAHDSGLTRSIGGEGIPRVQGTACVSTRLRRHADWARGVESRVQVELSGGGGGGTCAGPHGGSAREDVRLPA